MSRLAEVEVRHALGKGDGKQDKKNAAADPV